MRDGGQNLFSVKGRPPDVPYVPPKDWKEAISRLLWLMAIALTVGSGCLVIDTVLRNLTGVN